MHSFAFYFADFSEIQLKFGLNLDGNLKQSAILTHTL